MYQVYVIENSADSSWYIGFTTDVERRLEEHRQGIGGKHTRKSPGSWSLIYSESYLDKRDALQREKFLKSGSGRKYLRQQLRHYLETGPRSSGVEQLHGKE